MATITTAHTATGNANQVQVKHKDKVTYSVTGTFVATWVLERTLTGGKTWEQIDTGTSTKSSTTITNENINSSNYRFRCSAYTSGTMTTVLAESVSEVTSSLKDKHGTDVIEILEGKVKVVGDLEVTGNQTVTGTQVFTGGTTFDGDATFQGPGNVDFSPTGNLTGNPTGNIDLGPTGYVSLSAGGVTDNTQSATGGNVILSASTAGKSVKVDGNIQFDILDTAVSATTTQNTIINVTDTSAARTITLESTNNIDGVVVAVKDSGGQAGSFPITVIPESGNIDGAASFLINEDYGSAWFFGDATNWFSLVPGGASQALNGSKIGAVNAPASGTTSVIIRRRGSFFELHFTLTAAQIPVTDDGGNGSFGTLKLFDFAEGGVMYLGSRQNYTAYSPDETGVPDDTVFEIGVGSTAISAAADGALGATEDDIGGDVNQTLSSGTTTGTGFTHSTSIVDGTTTATDLNLNFSGTADTVDGNGTIDVTGTITVVGCFLGDD
jgi:hypothetical protein